MKAFSLKANQSRLSLQTVKQSYAVYRSKGEQGIFDPFKFSLSLKGHTPSLGEFATFSLTDITGKQNFYGKVASINYCQNLTELCLVSCLIDLKQQWRNKLYVQQSVIDVAAAILAEIDSSLAVVKRLRQTYLPKVHIMQTITESSWEFMQRILSEAGVFLINYFDRELAREVVLLGDHNDVFIQRDGFAAQGSHLFQIKEQLKQGSTAVILQTRSEHHSDKLTAQQFTKIEGSVGSQMVFGCDAQNQKKLVDQAIIYAEAIVIETSKLTIKTDLIDLAVGQKIQLEADCFEGSSSGEYLVLKIIHEINEEAPSLNRGVSQPYYNVATLCAAAQPYRAKISAEPALMIGFLGSLVETTDTADLTEEGKQRIYPRFSDASSEPLSRMQAALGIESAYGVHLPIASRAELIFSPINGDADQLLILASLPTGIHQTPVTQDNPDALILRTAGGHELNFNDQLNEAKIKLHTQNSENFLQLDHQNQQAVLKSSGSLNLSSACEFQTMSAADTKEFAEKKQEQIIHSAQETQVLKKISQSAKQSYVLNSINKIVQKSKHNLVLKSTADFAHHAKSLHLSAQKSDIKGIIKRDKSFIDAAKIIEILGQGELHLQNGTTGLSLNQNVVDFWGAESTLCADDGVDVQATVNYQTLL